MLEKFTVDKLAEQVGLQLQRGQVTSQLAHSFFRKGRRDGRRSLDYNSLGGLLLDSVGLAGSNLCQQMLARRQTVELQIVELHAIREAQAAAISESVASGDVTRTHGESGSGREDDSDAALVIALKARQRMRLDKARLDALDASRRAQDDLSRAEAILLGLVAEYRQRFEGAAHAGQMLWSRYCNGFEQGHAKRGSRDCKLDPPIAVLDFTMPPLLNAVATQDALHVDDRTAEDRAAVHSI
jgi:hypothetical protein